MPAEARDAMERYAAGSALRAVGMIVQVVAFSVFGMLGGLLGVAMFKKNAPPPPPGTVGPPPPPPGTVDVLPPEYPPS
jgi:hypothetical protein